MDPAIKNEPTMAPFFKHRTSLLITLICFGAFILSGCVPGDGSYSMGDPANFWSGLWHGMILCITFIWSLFDPSVTIYEVANNGAWYNFGFVLGVGGSVGGSSGTASRRRRSE